jgi:hypothetical protein
MQTEGTDPLHHPAAGVLGQAAQQRHAGMHVCVDEARQDDMAGGIYRAVGLILPCNRVRRCYGDDAAAINGERGVGAVADPVACHCQRVRRQNYEIYSH